MRSLRLLTVVCLLLPLASLPVMGQASGTSTVTGTIFDKSGAAIPNATVELKDLGTNATRTAASNDVGQYTFTGIEPGDYKVTVTAPGFRKAVIADLKVSVGKSALLNVTLEVGTVTQVVEVQAGTATELQTLDASMGNVMEKKLLINLPALSRDATALLLLQPMAAPGFNSNPLASVNGEGDNTGGQVAGARSDQNTFMVDGGDATDSTAGGGQYSGTNFTATPRAVVPTPVESLEEFHVTTNNPGSSFGRSEGGVVEMVTRKGTNSIHGAAYEFLGNDYLNANSWTRNSLGLVRPRLRDNRFGARMGGPIWKDKTFIFGHYEGRRYFQGLDIQRLVPTEALKVGIVHFVDATGAVQAFNLNNAPTMDPGIPTGTGCISGFTPSAVPIAPSGFDDVANGGRALYADPTVVGAAGVWNFEPTGNDCSRGDKLNTVGFSSTAPFHIKEDFAVVRVDHKITQNWQATASFRIGKTTADQPTQIDIGGQLPGDKKGSPVLTSKEPLQPRYFVIGLQGNIGSHWTSDFHFDYLRHYWQWQRHHPSPQVAGVTQALSIGSGSDGVSTTLIPVNVNVQDARSRTWWGHDWNFSENMSWIHGNHMVQFGGRADIQHFVHLRDDKVLVATIYPFATVGRLSSSSGISPFSLATLGAHCTPTTPGCPSFSISNTTIRRNIASVLGMVDRAAVLSTRASDFSPNPPLTPLLQHTAVDSYQLYVGDTWKIKPSITLSFGLNYAVQQPPFESSGKQTIMIDDTTKKPIIGAEYLAARKAAALAGTVFNPQWDFVPIKSTGRKYPYDPDYSNFGPRASVAWAPSYSSGWMGSVFGQNKTVVRGGYARIYDRLNGVGIVMIPALGIGFGGVVRCKGPRVPVGGVVRCATGSNVSNAFRIGTDGSTVPLPPLSPIAAGQPLIPGTNSPFELLDFRIDPHRKVGYSDGADFSIQRELPGDMLIEVGFVSRWSKRLYQGYGLSHVPYMTTVGGQSFQQAFSSVANALRSGTAAGAIPNQPFFEAALGGAASAYCSGATSCTQAVIGNNGTAAFMEANVYDVWDEMGSDAFGIANSIFVNGSGADSNQVLDSYWIGSGGHSNYNAGFLTLRKRTSHGLTFDVNYTYSHAFDQIGQNQESLNESTDAFNLDRDYASAQFDRRHTLNALITYDLPFGKGKMYSTGNWADNVIGGWNLSTIYSIGTGLPLDVFDGNSCEEYGAGAIFGNCSAYVPIASPKLIHATPHTIGTGASASSNAFANPSAVIANFRTPDILLDGRTGRGAVRSFTRWNVDFGVSKITKITERVNVRFDAQFSNLFNHPLKASSVQTNTDVFLDLSNPSNFGQLATQYNVPRFIQFGLKVEF